MRAILGSRAGRAATLRAVRRVPPVVLALLLWAAPAHAFSKQTGFQTMTDGTRVAYVSVGTRRDQIIEL